ncbi:MAG: four helix bundle protein [candidate division WOR-3 bacterium]
MKEKIKSIDDFVVYQKTVQLFNDFVNEDLLILLRTVVGRELAKNQVRSLDSMCANIEEGFERKTGKELRYFFIISRGSSGESRGGYLRCKKFLPLSTIEKRVKLLNEILAMLNSLISKLRG